MDKYAAVSWEEEQTFSAIKIKHVRVTEPDGWSCSMIVGRQYDAETKPGEFHKCEIIATGTRKRMEKVVLDKAAEAADSSFMEKDEDFFETQKQTRKERAKRLSESVPEVNDRDRTKRQRFAEKDENRQRNSEDIVTQMKIPSTPPLFSMQEAEQAGASDGDNIENFDPAVMGALNETAGEGNSESNEVQNLKRRLRQALRRNKILEEKVRMLEKPSIAAEPPQVVIGDGITANKAVVDDIIMDWSRNPSKFLRQLMLRTKIFSLEEMANSSVKGCRSRDGRRPALDVHKFSAVKSFTIRTCGIRENTVEMLTFEKSIVSLCTDARKALQTKSASQIL